MDSCLADEITPWETEEIPNQDLLFMHIHRQWLHDDGSISAGAFQNRPTKDDGMSTNWEKYSSARATKERARSPEDNAVVKMLAVNAGDIPGQTITHTPQQTNRAHTDIFGEKNPEARVLFGRIVEIVIGIDE